VFRIPRAVRYGPLLLAVAGCAGLPPDRGYDGVARRVSRDPAFGAPVRRP
jgi:hypothetical protein